MPQASTCHVQYHKDASLMVITDCVRTCTFQPTNPPFASGFDLLQGPSCCVEPSSNTKWHLSALLFPKMLAVSSDWLPEPFVWLTTWFAFKTCLIMHFRHWLFLTICAWSQVVSGFDLLQGPSCCVEQYRSIGLTIISAPEPQHYYSLFSLSIGFDVVLSMYDYNRYEMECK